MSGAVKSVGKVFKKVAKSKVGQLAVGLAASYFTAGLGSSLLGTLGASQTFLNSTLGVVLSNAISGAAAGAITSGLAGGNPLKGALFGGLGGAVTGGIRSYLGADSLVGSAGQDTLGGGAVGADDLLTDHTSLEGLDTGFTPANASLNVNTAADPGFTPQNANLSAPADTKGLLVNASAQGATEPVQNALDVSPAPAESSATSKFADALGLSEKELKGKAISGAAEFGLKGLLSGDDDEALLQANREKLAAQQGVLSDIRRSHSEATRGLLTPGTTQPAAPPGALPPSQRWPYDTGYANGQWQYDPKQKRIVFVPNQPAPATAPPTAA